MKQIVVNHENLQTRIALVLNGRIEEYYIEREDTKRIVGSIFKGRIRNLESSLQAAFVDIGLDKNAFLHYWDMIPATKELLEESDGEDDDDDSPDTERDNPESQSNNRSQGGRGRSNSNSSQDDNGSSGGGRRNNRRRRSNGNNGDKEGNADKKNEENRNSRKADDVASDRPKSSLTHTLRKIFTKPLFNRDEASKGEKSGSNDSKGGNSRKDSGSDRKNNSGNRNDGDRNDNRGNRNDNRNDNRGNGGRRNKGGRGRPKKKRIDLDEIPKRFEVNSEVVVQVSKGMIGEKGPRVTTNLSIPGRYVVILPNSEHRGVSRRIPDRRERGRLRQILQKMDMPKGMGVICRTASQGLSEAAIHDDINQILVKWKQGEQLKRRRAPVCIYQEPLLLERALRDFLSEGIDEVIADSKEAYGQTLEIVKRIDKERRPRVKFYNNPRPIFEHLKLTEQIRNIFQRNIVLPSGAELCIDETEALIAIDINSSKSRGGKDHPETILNTNLEAAAEIGRQLKMRNIGGLIVIDFIDMRSRKDQHKVYRKMQEVLSRDRAKNKILPISRLGLMEMTRQREHASLQDAVYETCGYCDGRGLIKSATTISTEIQRALESRMRRDRGNLTAIRVIVHPRVLERLKKEDSQLLEQMEKDFGGDLSFRADPDIHQEEFYFVNSKTGKEIR